MCYPMKKNHIQCAITKKTAKFEIRKVGLKITLTDMELPTEEFVLFLVLSKKRSIKSKYTRIYLNIVRHRI